ncbi:MAG: hypothetical protein HW412_2650 [Bacteroidetes bacterium]|nr:hypothetical protein [Bacteroidota bacterium]
MKRQLWGVVLFVCLVSGCAGTVGTKNEVIEVGWLDRSVLDKPEQHQFKERYDTVAIDQDLVELVRSVGDSRRELPHFLKIADRCGIEPSRIRFYGLDRSKKSSDGLTDQYQLEKVPTFIFLKNGTEVGRITEKPQGTLEADILAILAASQQK